MKGRRTDQTGSAVIIAVMATALVALIIVILVLVGGGDDELPAPSPADEADDSSLSIQNPKFEVNSVGFAPGNNHVIVALEVISHETAPFMIGCQYVVGSGSSGGIAGDYESYTIQPGENSFSDEIFSGKIPSQQVAGAPYPTGADLVADFDDLSFSILNNCRPIWVLKAFDADTGPVALEVLNYNPADLIRDFGEVRYRPASPATCNYRLESFARHRTSVDPEAYSPYSSAGPEGVVFDGIFHTHILANNCGQWQRNDLDCKEWDEVQMDLDYLRLLGDGETIRKPDNC